MKIWSQSFTDGDAIPARYAFGKHDDVSHFAFSDNCNPHLSWVEAPDGTRSFVVICHDSDVPSEGSKVNKEGVTVPIDLPRVDFFHWVLADLPPTVAEVSESSVSSSVTPRGKSGPEAIHGGRHGINDYTGWFAGNPDMEGQYFGYDGPAPPWNDERLHHYHFTVFALAVDRAPVEGIFSGGDLREAIGPHVLASATLTGTYAINPDVA